MSSASAKHVGALLAAGVLLLNSCGGSGSISGPSPGPGPGPAANAEGVVVVGQANSTNFPTTSGALGGQFQGGSDDGYVASINFPTSSNANGQFRFATYFGGSDFEQVRDVAFDAQGNIYVTGRVFSKNLPTTPGAFQPAFRGGPMDAYVAKLSPTGQLIFCTYLGGSAYDVGYSIAVDMEGFIYVSGRTSSPNFSVTAGALQTVYAGGRSTLAPYFGGDVFVVKMKPDGSGLVWGTYVGGSSDDVARGRLTVDANGMIYVEGVTFSSDFATTLNAAQRVLHGSQDAFIFKLSPDGSQLLFSTYLGGIETAEEGAVGGIAVNSQGDTYACGTTSAADFPTTPGAQDRTFAGPADIFLARLASNGSLVAATLLGGSGSDTCEGLVLDSTGRPIVLGTAQSSNFPTTPGVYQTTFGGGTNDFTVTKLSADLSTLIFSTYIGKSGNEVGDTLRVDVDPSDNIVFVGSTDSSAFPVTVGAVQNLYGGGARDSVIVKLSADGSQIIYATYLGGSGDDFPRAIHYRPK